MGKTTAEDILFVLRYEAKQARSGNMVVDRYENETDTRPLFARDIPRECCNWLWVYMILTYDEYTECLSSNKIKKLNMRGINDVLDKGLTDKEVLDLYKRL